MTRPTDTLLAALERRRHAQARHAWPTLVHHADRFCQQCQTHLANQGGGDRRQLCPSCADLLGGGT